MRRYLCLAVVLLLVLSPLLSGCSDDSKQSKRTAGEKASSPGPRKHNDGVRCDRFEVKAIMKGESVELVLDTDLPDDAAVMLSAHRTYREKGNNPNYLIDYFSKKLRVGDLRHAFSIPVGDKKAIARFEAKRDKFATIGMAGEIESISDYIDVHLVVPVGQPNPAFGRRNENLRGKMVKAGKSGLRVVEWEKRFLSPLARRPSMQATLADPQRLTPGASYRLSARTPLMPEFEPADAMAAIGKMKHVPGGGTIMVRSMRQRGHALKTPWYQVQAKDAQGRAIAEGWVNSIALIGQRVQIVRPKPVPPETPARSEQAAQRKLRLAQTYTSAGMKEKAKTILEEVVREYPETRAANKARELLKSLQN